MEASTDTYQLNRGDPLQSLYFDVATGSVHPDEGTFSKAKRTWHCYNCTEFELLSGGGYPADFTCPHAKEVALYALGNVVPGGGDTNRQLLELSKTKATELYTAAHLVRMSRCEWVWENCYAFRRDDGCLKTAGKVIMWALSLTIVVPIFIFGIAKILDCCSGSAVEAAQPVSTPQQNNTNDLAVGKECLIGMLSSIKRDNVDGPFHAGPINSLFSGGMHTQSALQISRNLQALSQKQRASVVEQFNSALEQKIITYRDSIASVFSMINGYITRDRLADHILLIE